MACQYTPTGRTKGVSPIENQEIKASEKPCFYNQTDKEIQGGLSI